MKEQRQVRRSSSLGYRAYDQKGYETRREARAINELLTVLSIFVVAFGILYL